VIILPVTTIMDALELLRFKKIELDVLQRYLTNMASALLAVSYIVVHLLKV